MYERNTKYGSMCVFHFCFAVECDNDIFYLYTQKSTTHVHYIYNIHNCVLDNTNCIATNKFKWIW